MSLLRSIRVHFRTWRFERLRAAHFRKYGVPHRYAGFTLIELVVVLAVVAILSVWAATTYANVAGKAQAGEGPQLAAAMQQAMVTVYQNTGAWPATDAAANTSEITGKYSTVNVDGNGNIAILYTAAANAPVAGTLLMLTPWLSTDGQTVVWTCGSVAAPVFTANTNGGIAGAGTQLSGGLGASTTPNAYLSQACQH